jgi:hypothetical protein
MVKHRNGRLWVRFALIAAPLAAGCDLEHPPGAQDAAVPDARPSDAALADATYDTDAACTTSADAGVATEAAADAANDAASDAASDAAPDGSASDAATDVSVSDAASDGSVSDASGDADASTESTLSVLATATPDCLACAETAQCLAINGSCEDLVGNVAPDGSPSAGTSRVSLCLDTLACVLRTGCTDVSTIDDLACYCGSACADGGAPDGPCAAAEMAGIEQTDPAAIEDVSNFYDTALGGGRANSLVTCLAQAGCNSCFPAKQ